EVEVLRRLQLRTSSRPGVQMKAVPPTGHVGIPPLRCVACGTLQRRVGPAFRCSDCGELLEVVYPDWGALDREAVQRLKQVWKERRSSMAARDVSGVWRYRELLPSVEAQHIVTMCAGNTP